MKKILLIEPGYKNKYPPLGLMKISTFHKQKGDNVVFYKGCSSMLGEQVWDRIYISTLFTFYWNITIRTIKYYYNSVRNPSDIYVGGVMATLMKEDIQKEVDVTVIEGLLNVVGKLGYLDDDKIDNILPDYTIVDNKSNNLLNYSYPTNDSYIVYATRGCIRKCQFCAVPIIEPTFTNSLSIASQVRAIKDQFGEKRHLLLLDNNILASIDFPKIVDEIKSLGYEKGNKHLAESNSRKIYITKHVDFNQGIDARLLTKENMRLLSEISINPLRLAFDDIKYKNIYIKKIRLAAEYGIKVLSNYILFNFKDTPEDFYERLKINIELNEEFQNKGLQSHIWSFPMRYSPITGEYSKNRRYIGAHWNRKYLRGVQCILLATHGVVGPKRQFFERAFGKDSDEFIKILTLPESYIIFRNNHLDNGDLNNLEIKINALNNQQKGILEKIILNNDFDNVTNKAHDKAILDILKYYRLRR